MEIMKLLRERFYVLISVLFTVLVFALIISNFPVDADKDPTESPVADANVHTAEE